MCKINDVKAEVFSYGSPNEHQLTFNQFADAQSNVYCIKSLQKLVSRMAHSGVDTSPEDLIVNFSDATAYAFLSFSQPQGSQLVHEDLEQIHDDDLEEMDLKWNMALLSMRARKFYQRTGKKIVIDGSRTGGMINL
ncbi:hypothetical protein Tco_1146378 [Tanacetum coccineum]